MDQIEEVLLDAAVNVNREALSNELMRFKNFFFPVYAPLGFTFAEAWMAFNMQIIKEHTSKTNEILEEIYPSEESA